MSCSDRHTGSDTIVTVKSSRFILLCGDGAARKRLQAEAENLDNVLWLPLQPSEKLNELLNMADIHLLPQRADVADLVIPSKLTGMLASGRPLLATASRVIQVAQVLDNAGIVVSPGDVGQFVNELELLANEPAIRVKM